MTKSPDIFLVRPSDERRYWRVTNGGATYSVVAPNALWAMLYILKAEHDHGCTDDIAELSVEEIDATEAATRRIRGDDEPDIMFTEMPIGDVACSEWP